MKFKTDFVNPMIGTKNEKRFSEGNINPIVGLPNGLASFSIQTQTLNGFDKRWFFNPTSRSFEGIRLTHQPSPWVGDYGHLLIMPTDIGYLTPNTDTFFSTYDPTKTIFKPYVLKTHLFKYQIDLEMTPTHSGSKTSFHFGTNQKHGIIIKSYGNKNEWYKGKDGVLYGSFVAADHETPFELFTYVQIRLNTDFTINQIAKDFICLEFEESDVEMTLSTSFINHKQATLNFKRELNKTIKTLKRLALKEWENKLSKIIINESSKKIMEMFYTSMYRVFLFPRRFYEMDAKNIPHHIHLETGKITKGKMYVDNGFWDTYKTVYPLLSLIDQPLYKDILEGVYQYYLDTKKLPKWLSPTELGYMPGYLIYAVIADAIAKDIVSHYFALKLLDACIDFESNNERFNVFKTLGYYPMNTKESVNETLDAAYMYDCLAQMALKLNHPKYETFKSLSKNYQNLFDSETGFMRPKDELGNFPKEFNPIRWGGPYTEGSAWQNSFGVYHDIEGLNKLYNGNLASKIDEMFEMEPIFDIGDYGIEIHEMSEMSAQPFGQCAISNQPSFHIPYIYAYLGNKGKTDLILKEMVNKAFLNGKYPGDEDNGSMAGWFIFTVMGLYPMSPGHPLYVCSTPLVKSITLKTDTKEISLSDILLNHKDIMIKQDEIIQCHKDNLLNEKEEWE